MQFNLYFLIDSLDLEKALNLYEEIEDLIMDHGPTYIIKGGGLEPILELDIEAMDEPNGKEKIESM